MGGGKKTPARAAAIAGAGGVGGGAGAPLPGAAAPPAPAGSFAPTAAGYAGLEKAVSTAPKGSSPVLAAFAANVVAAWPAGAKAATAGSKKKVKHAALLAGSPVLDAAASPAYPDGAETPAKEAVPAAEAEAASLSEEEREKLSRAEGRAVAAFAGSGPGGEAVAYPALDLLSLVQKAREKVAAGAANLKLGTSEFSEKVRRIVDVFKFRRALREALTDVGSGEAAGLKLSYAGSAAHLGGVHEKHFYVDEKGRRWLFKPDKNAGGAKAAAEAAAAEIAQLAGAAALPAFVVRTERGVGCAQPFVENAQPLGPDPSKWSPAQVRELVRQHVVSWAVSDFDAKHDNFIATPAGAVVNVDKGQAFKYFGEDRLDLDYHPNKAYGSPPPAYYALYRAAREGKVQVNPYDALPVIEALEKVPDEQYREALRPLVEAAIKSPKKGEIAWWRRMAAFAAERLGRAPSPEEVGEEFLRRAVERKNSLRRDFAEFFGRVLGVRPAF
jgi:hypothetical protein